MKAGRNALVASVIASMLLLVAACGSPGAVQTQTTASEPGGDQDKGAAESEESSPSKRIKAEVVKVTDGDTIKVSVNGKEENVRFLLVDTPETHHPKLGEQPFGKEASAFTTELLTGKTVELEQDVSPGPDKYGRMLYYIYVDGKSVQEMLLEKGLARVAYIYVPNVKYVDKYREIQEKAQQAGVGIWSVENYAREDGYHSEAVNEPKKGSSRPMENTVRTPAADDGKTVYYASCKEARAAGAAPIRKGEPGYRVEMDGDQDGIACE